MTCLGARLRADWIRLEAIPIMGTAISETIAKFYNNSLDNIGRGDSVSLAVQ